jgi:hypothetical protein
MIDLPDDLNQLLDHCVRLSSVCLPVRNNFHTRGKLQQPCVLCERFESSRVREELQMPHACEKVRVDDHLSFGLAKTRQFGGLLLRCEEVVDK